MGNDIIAPSAPIVDQPTSPINITPITVTGTAEAISTVEVFVDGVSAGTTLSTGTFSLDNVALNEGSNSITATATDAAGNTSPSSIPVIVILDTVKPTVTITVVPDIITEVKDQGTVKFTLKFSESMDTGYIPVVTYDPEGATGPQPCTLGIWSKTIYPDDTYTVYNDNIIDPATGDGIAKISVSGARDLADNIMEPDTDDTFIINLKPLAIHNDTADPGKFNPYEEESTIISYVLSETAEDVDVTIYDQANVVIKQLISNQAQSGGQHKLTWDGTDTLGIISPDGDYTCKIIAQSPSLGELATASITITIDSTIPVISNLSDTPDPLSLNGISTITFDTSAPGDGIYLQQKHIIFNSSKVIVDESPWPPDVVEGPGQEVIWDSINQGEGLYQYELRARISADKTKKANPKTGTILIRDKNSATAYSLDGIIEVWYDSLSYDISISDVDPSQVPDATKSITTADPFLYLQSDLYNIQSIPTGITFDPPLILIFNYSPELYGGGLQIRSYNTTTETWDYVDRQYVDGANNRIIAEIDILSLFALFIGVDTTPPEVTASLIPIDVEETEGLFRVEYSAIDNLDPNPTVTAVMEIPSTPEDVEINLEFVDDLNKSIIKFELMYDLWEIKLEGYDEETLLDILAQAIDEGGFSVENGQEVQLELGPEKEHKYVFENGVLTFIEAPSFTLTVKAEDFAGNVSTISVNPVFSPEEEEEDIEEDNEIDNKDNNEEDEQEDKKGRKGKK